MNWEYYKGLAYEYWYYVAFSLLVLVVVLISLFYIQGQFERRRDRLKTVHLYKVNQRGDTVPEVAGLDIVINGVLFPRPEVYLPLQDRLSLKVDWGPDVRHWTLRDQPVPSQSAPSLRGPP